MGVVITKSNGVIDIDLGGDFGVLVTIGSAMFVNTQHPKIVEVGVAGIDTPMKWKVGHVTSVGGVAIPTDSTWRLVLRAALKDIISTT